MGRGTSSAVPSALTGSTRIDSCTCKYSAWPGGSPRGGGGGAASQPLRFFPFSQGARDCIGQSLAKINYTATLAALLGRYSFKIAPQVSGTLVEMHCLIAMFLLGF